MNNKSIYIVTCNFKEINSLKFNSESEAAWYLIKDRKCCKSIGNRLYDKRRNEYRIKEIKG